MELDAIARVIQERIAAAQITFDQELVIAPGGSRCIYVQGATAEVRQGDVPAACSIHLSPDVLAGLVSGEIDKTEAFFDGRIAVTGDMTVAMKMGEVF